LPHLVRAYPNDNRPIIAGGEGPAELCYFNLLRLGEGESLRINKPGFELVFVVLSGRADITVGSQSFPEVGRRPDIWSGRADSVYAGTQAETVVTGRAPETELALAGGRCLDAFAPFRIRPEEVEMVDVGSAETHSRRRVFHILGQNANGRAGNLLVSELLADPGCWSGYPPHKHDEERPPDETEFQELYHYRFRPSTGFGGQFCYGQEGAPTVVMTHDRDTFVVERGYHPTVVSPGHEEYIFTIIVGRHQRSLIQSFEPSHLHLMNRIPGLQAMRDKFK